MWPITWSPLNLGHHLYSEVLLTEPVVAVVPQADSMAQSHRLHADQLAATPRIRWPGCPQWTGESGPSAASDTRAGSIAEMFTLVALGRGVALAPSSLSLSHRWPDITFVPVTGCAPSKLTIAWPAEITSEAVARFVQVAREEAGKPEWRQMGRAAGEPS